MDISSTSHFIRIHFLWKGVLKRNKSYGPMNLLKIGVILLLFFSNISSGFSQSGIGDPIFLETFGKVGDNPAEEDSFNDGAGADVYFKRQGLSYINSIDFFSPALWTNIESQKTDYQKSHELFSRKIEITPLGDGRGYTLPLPQSVIDGNWGPAYVDYLENSIGLPPEGGKGGYSIVTDTRGYYNEYFVSSPDHTDDENGYMLLVDAHSSTTTYFTRKIEGLCGGDYFRFSTWIIDLNTSDEQEPDGGGGLESSAHPRVRFDIFRVNSDGSKGELISSRTTTDSEVKPRHNWYELKFDFQLPSDQTGVFLEITNVVPNQYGNDLAIDDISFSPLGPEAILESADAICPGDDPLLRARTINSLYPFFENHFQLQYRPVGATSSWINIGSSIVNSDVDATVSFPNPYLNLDPNESFEFRVLVAASNETLINSNCRVVSEKVVNVYAHNVELESSDTNICEGSSALITSNLTDTLTTTEVNYIYLWERQTDSGWETVTDSDGDKTKLVLENVTRSSNYRLTVSVEGAQECASKTDEISIEVTEIKSAGGNGTLTICEGTSLDDVLLFNSLEGNPSPGGVWSNVGNVYTYTVAPTSPCTLASTATVTLSFINCTLTPSLSIEKVADKKVVSEEGEIITYTLTVTNTGNLPLTNIDVMDPLTGFVDMIDELVPGDSETFSTTYSVTLTDLLEGKIVNVAVVSAKDPNGGDEDVKDEDEEIVTVDCLDNTLITGVILNNLTGEPLAGVPVTLLPQEGTIGEQLIVVTGEDGRYIFKDFVPGQYLVQVQDANLNSSRGLYPVESSLFFTLIEVCEFQVKDFRYEIYDGIVLGDFVWYDLNGDGIQNEWFDADGDGQVTQNPINGTPISIREWEWFDLNGDGRYDGPENEGELNKAGFGNDQSANIKVTGPNSFEEDIIVGILGYWRSRPDAGSGEYTATMIVDSFIKDQASFMRSFNKVTVLPGSGSRMTDINGVRIEEQCGLTTEGSITRTTSSTDKVFLDMDFGWRCLDEEIEIIANDDDFGTYFLSYGGVLGNILTNDLLDGQEPDPADVDIIFIDFGGLLGVSVDENGVLTLIPGLNPAGTYTLTYVLSETAFPDNQDQATVTITIINDQVDLAVVKTSFEAEVYEGDEFEYEITLSNIGGTPATNVVLIDDLPNGLTYLSSTIVSVNDSQIQVGAPAVTGSRITWTIPFLPADGVVVIRVKVQAGDAGTITNLVGVSSDEDDTNELDNQGDDVNQVIPFRIPNVITPNQDGDNDSFEIKGLGKFVSNEIVIINRYGDHVFERENYQNDWDAPGQVAGTYFYILTTVDKAGKSHVYKGWIQVIKNEE